MIISGVACGNCCCNHLPCDNCLNETIKANGLSANDKERLTGLSHRNNHSFERWRFSDLCIAIDKILQEKKL